MSLAFTFWGWGGGWQHGLLYLIKCIGKGNYDGTNGTCLDSIWQNEYRFRVINLSEKIASSDE